VAAFAALSAPARSIGILRRLTVIPVLAQTHASADPATRATIELVFEATTAWGGGIEPNSRGGTGAAARPAPAGPRDQ